MDRFNKSCILVCAAFTLGGLALLTTIVSISTNYWLYVTEELSLKYFITYDTIEYEEMDESMENSTFPDKFEVSLVIGLWRFCSVAMEFTFCENLDYKIPKIERQEVAISIAESQREASPMFLTALVLLIVSGIFNVMGNIKWFRVTMVASISYILTALFIVVGMVIYIANIQREMQKVADLKRKDVSVDCSYGWSFYVMWLSFIMSFADAIICIVIFLNEWKKIHSTAEIKMQLTNISDENEMTV
ncbi:voltage-dependent calcium channel gamma-8 subunit-like [Mytilus californianus]|uniref:voltage-dependent calcium channel gamma-8 subunit-like n=1 Tax=Mytilus californianus TaxID=6549 RepID=UPI0022478E9F|nr:voltage-dependent calcium channel gamma-8 subunit-like [Mytilus californianus]